MCRQPVKTPTLFTTAIPTWVGFITSVFALTATAEVVDIGKQAAASRDKLEARIAYVDGDLLRGNLLNTAGNERLARWYAGEIMVDNQWLTLEQIQQQTANDKHLASYRNLREQATDRLADHERLARWCKKHDLEDLANMHWLHVLRFDQRHRAALSELELIWHQGKLLTLDEAERSRQREREWLKQKKTWRATAIRLRRELEQDDPEQKIAARQELRKIRAPAAVPALLEEFSEPARDEDKTITRQTELLATLGGINSQQAIEVLVEYAVLDPDESVRYAAIDQLKAKPFQEYVPQLLSEMQMPIEASVSINQIGNQIVNHYIYAQDTPYGDYERDYQTSRTIPGQRYVSTDLYRRRTRQETTYIPARHREAFECNGHIVPASTTPARTNTRNETTTEYVDTLYAEHPAYRTNRRNTLNRSKAQAAAADNQIARRNNALRVQNERIADVLNEVTGETLSAFPKSWWNWWGDYLDRHPDIATVGARQQLNMALLNQQQRGLARGTWVWTQLGKQPVEKVLPGDFVLAQGPQTGELAYKIVLAIANPQEITVTKIDLNGFALHAAPGHVIWTTGAGWQRVSKLSAGQSLHGAITENRIADVETAFDIESYDLIVDGFHTFFVGEQGLLVHDATPISPSGVALPGFSPAAVADAAQMAINNP